MQEFKDSRLKYLEMSTAFSAKINELTLTCKQHLRTCEALAKRLAAENPKTQKEFDKIEFYKDFVIKTSQMNDQAISLVKYTQEIFESILSDSSLLIEADVKDTLRLQSESIEVLTNQREELVKMVYELRRDKITSKG